MFAVSASRADNPSDMSFFIINSISGRIVYQILEKNVNRSTKAQVNAILSENKFIISFQRTNIATGISQQELSVTEFYRPRVEDDTFKMLKDYMKGAKRITDQKYSSFSEENNPEFVSESYTSPFPIKTMCLTQTRNRITGKNLILVNGKNQIFQLEQHFYTSRRPLSGGNGVKPEPEEPVNPFAPIDETAAKKPINLKNYDFITYDPVFPERPQQMVSYNVELSEIRSVKAFSTKLESTSQVFAFGHDLYFTRVSPEKQFDLLEEDFPYALMFIGIIGLYVADFAFKTYMKDRNDRKVFLTQ